LQVVHLLHLMGCALGKHSLELEENVAAKDEASAR